ncbi:MAG TPA: methyltransferase domain-containing protein [Bryobacteraceae bacterium]
MSEALLRDLYQRQLEALPADDYLRSHAESAFLSGSLRVFRFYEPYLPRDGEILDWGCHHAPDSCLIRASVGDGVTLHGCDVLEPGHYKIFHESVRLRYRRLDHITALPYEDASFDAVVASGVLEHVAMDYESLRELYRVLKPNGRLIVTYLPNRTSYAEWRLRRSGGAFHHRLYSRREMASLLLHSGFLPLVCGYQTQLDALPSDGALRLLRVTQLHRLTSCLCAVAEKRLSI